jgi:multidrug efflux pump subunit AcrA (membrane-fusion protein)
VERRVELGRRAGSQVEIVSGLTAGETIITEPGSLVAGDAVRGSPSR